MSKHLNLIEWLHFFKLYESNKRIFRVEYALYKSAKPTRNFYGYFKRKYELYKKTNMNELLISKTGFAAKKGKGSDRKKKRNIDSSYNNKEDIDQILNHYIDMIKKSNDPKEQKILEKLLKIICFNKIMVPI